MSSADRTVRRGYDNRRRRAQAQATAERILAAAADLVGRGGSLDVAMGDVAAAAGVSQPTVFRHFATKADLFSALASRAFRTVTEGLAPASVAEFGAAIAVVFRRSAAEAPLIRWLLASPLGAATPRPHREERLAMIRGALGLRDADPDARFAERAALLLSSPMAWLYWHDYLGLSEEEAAETAAWAVRRITAV